MQKKKKEQRSYKNLPNGQFLGLLHTPTRAASKHRANWLEHISLGKYHISDPVPGGKLFSCQRQAWKKSPLHTNSKLLFSVTGDSFITTLDDSFRSG